MPTIWLVPGSKAVVRENGEHIIQSRTFATDAELNAFWDGVETAVGYDDVFSADTEEEAKRYVASIQGNE